MRLHSLLCFALVVSLACRALSDDSLVFPVMAWNHAPNEPAVLQQMKDCGITIAGFVAPGTLDAVHAAGMRAIVSDPRVNGYDWQNVDEKVARERVQSLVQEVGSHPAVYGYNLRDEPSAKLFPGLAKVASFIHELAPGKWAYINLFPNYASPEQLGTKDYPSYLEEFVATCKPTTLSYDHYALLDDGSLRPGYWSNLTQMRDAAKKHGLPFWNIVLATAHFNYREVTAADLRFQVYSTLAWGGRGIAYFNYFAPEVGNYRMAPVDQFGNPTETWKHLQNVNLQIAKLAPTLLQLRSDEVYHFGTPPDDGAGPSESSLVRAIAGEFAAGDFTHADGSRYVMLVNRDVLRSIPCQPEFRSPTKNVELVSPYTGKLVGFSGEQIWLAPGQGALLKVTQ
ncbi:MAG: hypothetical protein ACO1QR_16940 [Chthoniobacteraceae bacterium]